jgi:hypothetical protein
MEVKVNRDKIEGSKKNFPFILESGGWVRKTVVARI